MSVASQQSPSKPKFDIQKIVGRNGENIILPLLGIFILIVIWSIIAKLTEGGISQLPSPIQAFQDSIPYLQNFFSTTQGDEGIFFLTLFSLLRVAVGFAIAVVIAVPLGFLIGTSKTAQKMLMPLVQIGKPISPLAWLPVGIVVATALLTDAPKMVAQNVPAIFVIVVTSLWPTLINTALGVKSIPQDYWNVSKVLNLSRSKVITKVMIPSTLPYIFAGMRLSLGIAWLVIVAAEMLTGGTGIGFFVWDTYNTGEISLVILSLFVIGLVGLLLDQFVAVIERLAFGENR
ncbi:MAG: nitrate ABC transporter permease [Jaaginema sp. PMC 1079.18]|nr:nitrate ABC transporter permease [Jaaginema sp. PMC 1080.18]MEC4850580.1 nitrate ABC transporter permease [Jaaginema sp. PMC 1079.18]MEC4867088.1 nitrate ABC transporter permease [Jaaginema sp. PMC 1078.18]